MNKKAERTILANIIGIIVAIIIIGATIYIFAKAGSMILPKEGQKSEASLNRLGLKISELAANNAKNKADKMGGFFVERDYPIYFFNENIVTYPAGKDTATKHDQKINRPDTCLDRACVCSCKVKEKKNENSECTEAKCYALKENFKFKGADYFNTFFERQGSYNVWVCKKGNYIEISYEGAILGKSYDKFVKDCEGES